MFHLVIYVIILCYFILFYFLFYFYLRSVGATKSKIAGFARPSFSLDEGTR